MVVSGITLLQQAEGSGGSRDICGPRLQAIWWWILCWKPKCCWGSILNRCYTLFSD